MMPSISRQRYSPISIALHWIMLLLLVAVYACMELREFHPRGSDLREGLKTWHYMSTWLFWGFWKSAAAS